MKLLWAFLWKLNGGLWKVMFVHQILLIADQATYVFVRHANVDFLAFYWQIFQSTSNLHICFLIKNNILSVQFCCALMLSVCLLFVQLLWDFVFVVCLWLHVPVCTWRGGLGLGALLNNVQSRTRWIETFFICSKFGTRFSFFSLLACNDICCLDSCTLFV